MSNTNLVLTKTDKKILNMMSKGMLYKEISKKLAADSKGPNSNSYIEKLIKKLKKNYKAKTSFQLAILLYADGVLD